PFDIHLRGSASFRPVSPVVFVTLALGISDCERLESKVRSGVLARELKFPYHPHVTVAHDLPEEQLDQADEALASYDAWF
uniref:2'-5' RNA ligase family protein n=1 Tax=Escherichia coli TaxID=562 RepID=UPI0019638830